VLCWFRQPCQVSRNCNLIQACQAANKLPPRGVTNCTLLGNDLTRYEAPDALSWLCCLVASVPVILLLPLDFHNKTENIADQRKTESTAPPAGCLLSKPLLLTLGLMNAQTAAAETLTTHVAGVYLGTPSPLRPTPQCRLGLGGRCHGTVCIPRVCCWCCKLFPGCRAVSLLHAAGHVTCCGALALCHLQTLLKL